MSTEPSLSIRARLEKAAGGTGGVRFVGKSVAPDGPVFVPWAQIHEEARAVGAALQARGVQPGDHVAVLGPTSRELITIVRGCWLAGVASMILPLPMRMGSLDEFVSSTRLRIRHGDAKLVLIDDQLAPFYEAIEGDPPIASMASVLPGSEGVPSGDRLEIPEDDPDRLVILQYTSGSTSEPKGVMIPDRVLAANIDAACEAASLREDEVMVSWLPLYHDMGLVGFLAIPMTTGVELVQAAPQDFMAHPSSWMEWISEWGGTATAGPNFSWVLATRGLRRSSDLDLSTLTLALNGAEPVDPKAMDAFCEAAAPYGFDPSAVFPAFGMAEVAIAGAFPRRGEGLLWDSIDREVLERERVAVPLVTEDEDEFTRRGRRLPLLGTAVPGLEMRVVDPESREELPERSVGELLMRGTSVTPGYYKRDDATAELLQDGWLCTGDLAYILDGQLVLCGRIKDVIIVGGRNVFPEDIERAVGTIDGVRAGNVIAFGVEGYKGKESVVVVAESRVENGDEIRSDIHQRTLEVCGLPPRDVILVEPSTLPKTSSGKLQRSKCRELYLAETLSVR
ncbi:MAG: AMP-binding protein [Actinomycetota bacterium]|nr:AMP-binding protein [Actinomycetota bacterium]MEC8521883.1 AMP-binding protein [Actinomycetota bacterium]MED5299116.1 AMP-binding protein [Actinomycetota bacterium]MED5328386.1 AMP-binding protein [Actinomycetota bacterium]MED5570873.1 AMP-binding protein [Actinomycetota bacterium]